MDLWRSAHRQSRVSLMRGRNAGISHIPKRDECIGRRLKSCAGDSIVGTLGVSVVWSTMPHVDGCDTSLCEDARPLFEIAGR